MKEIFNTIPDAIGVIDFNGASFANDKFISMMQPQNQKSVRLWMDLETYSCKKTCKVFSENIMVKYIVCIKMSSSTVS